MTMPAAAGTPPWPDDGLHTPPLQVEHRPAAARSLRLSVVTETWPPEVNGVAITLARLVEGLQERQHDVQLVRPRQPADGTRPGHGLAQARGATLHQVLVRGMTIPRYAELRMGLPARRALVRMWSIQRPDLVHIATEGPLGFSALRAARHLGLPVSSDFRTNFHAYSQHYGIGWLRTAIMGYLRRFHNHCALTLVPTDDLRQQLQQAGFRHLHTLSRGVDTLQFHPRWRSNALRAQWGATDDDLVVGCVGRLAAEKNLTQVLASFKAIQSMHPRARLVLVGDGPLRDALRRDCPHLILAGQRRGADLAAHYASLDLFLFASLTETFGNVTSEAMASGLPVVAYRHAGAAQLIEAGVHGELVACNDPAAFIRAALHLATDGPRRQRLALAARQRAQQQDWGRIVLQFEQLLAQAMDRPMGAVPPSIRHGAFTGASSPSPMLSGLSPTRSMQDGTKHS